MNLEGSLDAFGLRDLFLLLAGTGKTGALRLVHSSHDHAVDGVVHFVGGQVSSASADVSRLGLARRLVGVGALDDHGLTVALNAVADGGSGVVAALLAADAVDPGVLADAATEQTVDAVCELLRWSQGEFSFDIEATDPDDAGVRLAVAEVVSLADAREAAWADVAAVIPGPEAVLRLSVSLTEDPALTKDEWSLVALIDGRRTVEDLVLITGAGRFRVATVLAGLVDRGLVAVGDTRGDDHASIVERRLAMLARAEGARQAQPRAGVRPSRTPSAPQAPARPPAPAPASVPPPPTTARPGRAAAPSLPAPSAPTRAPRPAAAAVRRPAAGAGGDVVPGRPEPFLPSRRPDHAEPLPTRAGTARPPEPTARSAASVGGGAGGHQSVGSAAVASDGLVERDPSVNRSLLLRLIAGVRGL